MISFGVKKVTEIVNEIYDSGDIPTDLSKSISISLPKKPGTIECEMYRTISLMSHITKLILRIIMMRTRNKLKPEIGKEQCGFLEDPGKYWEQTAYMRVHGHFSDSTEIKRSMRFCLIYSTYTRENYA